MNRKEIVEILREYKSRCAEKYGISKMGLFGSVVREEKMEFNDVDVVVEIATPDMFILIGIKQELEKKFKLPVDIVRYRESMNQFLKRRIDNEAVYV